MGDQELALHHMVAAVQAATYADLADTDGHTLELLDASVASVESCEDPELLFQYVPHAQALFKGIDPIVLANSNTVLLLVRLLKGLSRNSTFRQSLGKECLQFLLPLLQPALNLRVAAEGASVLLNLCFDKQNVTALLEEGGVQLLINFLAEPDHSLLASSAGAIQSICYQRQGRQRMLRLGGIPPLVHLLDSEHPKVQERAAGAVHNLSSDAEAIKCLRHHHAIPKLVALLDSQQPHTAGSAAGALQNMAREVASRLAVLELQAVKPLTRLLSSAEPRVQICAAGALLNIMGPNLEQPDDNDGIRQATSHIISSLLSTSMIYHALFNERPPLDFLHLQTSSPPPPASLTPASSFRPFSASLLSSSRSPAARSHSCSPACVDDAHEHIQHTGDNVRHQRFHGTQGCDLVDTGIKPHTLHGASRSEYTKSHATYVQSSGVNVKVHGTPLCHDPDNGWKVAERADQLGSMSSISTGQGKAQDSGTVSGIGSLDEVRGGGFRARLLSWMSEPGTACGDEGEELGVNEDGAQQRQSGDGASVAFRPWVAGKHGSGMLGKDDIGVPGKDGSVVLDTCWSGVSGDGLGMLERDGTGTCERHGSGALDRAHLSATERDRPAECGRLVAWCSFSGSNGRPRVPQLPLTHQSLPGIRSLDTRSAASYSNPPMSALNELLLGTSPLRKALHATDPSPLHHSSGSITSPQNPLVSVSPLRSPLVRMKSAGPHRAKGLRPSVPRPRSSSFMSSSFDSAGGVRGFKNAGAATERGWRASVRPQAFVQGSVDAALQSLSLLQSGLQ